MAPVGAGGQRRRARRRQARLRPLRQHRVPPEKAEVILSLDSDFLASGPGHLRYMKDFYRRRKLDQFAEADRAGGEMNRLYVVEPTPSVTGSSADHRLPLRSSEIEQFARALAAKLGLGGSGARSLPAAEKWLDAVAKDLQKHRAKFVGRRRRTAARGSSCARARHQRSARKRRQHRLLHRAGRSQPGQ